MRRLGRFPGGDLPQISRAGGLEHRAGAVAHECGRQIEDVFLPERADDSAHVAQQELRDRLRRLDALAGLALSPMARDLEVQRKRRQVMAEQVVQIAGDSIAFGDPRALRQQLPRGLELGVGGGEAPAGFLANDGTLYVLFGEKPFSVKDAVKDLADVPIRLTGELVERGGVKGIQLKSINKVKR